MEKVREVKFIEINTDEFFDLNSIQKINVDDVEDFNNLQSIGLYVKYKVDESIKDEDYNKFLTLCKRIIDGGDVEKYLNIAYFNIESFDVNKKILLNRENKTPFYKWDGNDVSNDEDILHRSVLHFSFISNLTREELNKKYGDYFLLDGEMGREW